MRITTATPTAPSFLEKAAKSVAIVSIASLLMTLLGLAVTSAMEHPVGTVDNGGDLHSVYRSYPIDGAFSTAAEISFVVFITALVVWAVLRVRRIPAN